MSLKETYPPPPFPSHYLECMAKITRNSDPCSLHWVCKRIRKISDRVLWQNTLHQEPYPLPITFVYIETITRNSDPNVLYYISERNIPLPILSECIASITQNSDPCSLQCVWKNHTPFHHISEYIATITRDSDPCSLQCVWKKKNQDIWLSPMTKPLYQQKCQTGKETTE